MAQNIQENMTAFDLSMTTVMFCYVPRGFTADDLVNIMQQYAMKDPHRPKEHIDSGLIPGGWAKSRYQVVVFPGGGVAPREKNINNHSSDNNDNHPKRERGRS